MNHRVTNSCILMDLENDKLLRTYLANLCLTLFRHLST
jgi:hypothetical protein